MDPNRQKPMFPTPPANPMFRPGLSSQSLPRTPLTQSPGVMANHQHMFGGGNVKRVVSHWPFSPSHNPPREGREYVFNKFTKQSLWEMPTLGSPSGPSRSDSNMDSRQGVKICIKLVNNIQGRADKVLSNIDEGLTELDDQNKDGNITNMLTDSKQLVITILDCLDYLEYIIISDEEYLDQRPRPSSETVESDLFTAESKQQLQNHLPELYEDIQEFVKDQFENIDEIKYMMQISCNLSEEKHNAAVEMIEVIESQLDRMEDLFSLVEADDSGIVGYADESSPSVYYSYSDSNDPDVESWFYKQKFFPDVPHIVPYTPRSIDSRNALKIPTKKDGTPDMRYRINRGNLNRNKDGTPDRRYKENKPILLKKGETQVHIKKNGTPDRRYKENKVTTNNVTSASISATKGQLKKDGTQDMRYSSNKVPMTSTPVKSNKSSGPLKKDGTPDMRYAANKSSASSTKSFYSSGSSVSVSSYGGGSSSGLLKKDGTPDMRYAANKSSASSTKSSYSSGSSFSVSSYGGGSSSGPLKKDGTPDMRYAANKSSASRSSGSSYGGSSSYNGGGSSSSSYYSGSSYGGSGSSSSYCPGPTTKSGAPDMRFAANKAHFR